MEKYADWSAQGNHVSGLVAVLTDIGFKKKLFRKRLVREGVQVTYQLTIKEIPQTGSRPFEQPVTLVSLNADTADDAVAPYKAIDIFLHQQTKYVGCRCLLLGKV